MSREGLVKEILSKGNLTAEEIKGELWKRDISFVKSYDRPYNVLFWPLLLLWLLPAIARYSGWGFLSPFARLPRVDFPVAVIVMGMIFVIAAVALETKTTLMRRRLGRCHDTHESVVIIREGPYGVIRHPGYLAELVYFPLLPVILSRWVPFTILAMVYIVVWTGAIVYLIKAEDNFNLRKWGEEYRRYMEEVPAINFVEGLRRLKGKG